MPSIALGQPVIEVDKAVVIVQASDDETDYASLLRQHLDETLFEAAEAADLIMVEGDRVYAFFHKDFREFHQREKLIKQMAPLADALATGHGWLRLNELEPELREVVQDSFLAMGRNSPVEDNQFGQSDIPFTIYPSLALVLSDGKKSVRLSLSGITDHAPEGFLAEGRPLTDEEIEAVAAAKARKRIEPSNRSSVAVNIATFPYRTGTKLELSSIALELVAAVFARQRQEFDTAEQRIVDAIWTRYSDDFGSAFPEEGVDYQTLFGPIRSRLEQIISSRLELNGFTDRNEAIEFLMNSRVESSSGSLLIGVQQILPDGKLHQFGFPIAAAVGH